MSTEVSRRRTPERNVLPGETFAVRARRGLGKISPSQFFAELFEKRWMEPAIPVAVLFGVILYFSFTISTFATQPNFLTSSTEIAELTFLCLGMAVVMISGGIDLSVGAMFSLTNMLAIIFLTLVGMPAWLVVLATVAVGAFLGSINGVIVAYLKTRPFLTTLVTLIIFRGVLNLLDLKYSAKTAVVFIEDPLWDFFGQGRVAGVPFPFVVLIVVLLLGHLLLSRSRVGWHITAVGASRKAARHAGIRVERILLLSYVLSGALCGLGGVFYAARLSSASARVGEGLELTVLTAVILGGISLQGGRGTVWRALIGAATISLLGKGLLLMNIGGDVLQMVLAGVLLVAVALDAKWSKNRGKAIQKSYVNPVHLDFGDLTDTRRGSGSPYEVNDRLSNAEAIGEGMVEGPEDVILDSQGRIYCGNRQGWILRFSGPSFENREVLARIGGHPLGMAMDADENIVVCVAGMGLYKVTQDGEHTKLTDETNRTWTRLRDDSRMRMADDLDIAPDGRVFFSEATTRFDMGDWILDGVEGRPNGRLICYDPNTGKTRTVLRKPGLPQRRLRLPGRAVRPRRLHLAVPDHPLLVRRTGQGQGRGVHGQLPGLGGQHQPVLRRGLLGGAGRDAVAGLRPRHADAEVPPAHDQADPTRRVALPQHEPRVRGEGLRGRPGRRDALGPGRRLARLHHLDARVRRTPLHRGPREQPHRPDQAREHGRAPARRDAGRRQGGRPWLVS